MDPNDEIDPNFNPLPSIGVPASIPYGTISPYPPPIYHHHQQFQQQQQQQQQYQQQQRQQHQQELQIFWADQYREIEQTTDFRNHTLPLARIKKIMKSDEDVKMIAAEAPVVFARACEMFILQLTNRSWANAEENRRRTLQRNDIADAITRSDVFDFLVDVVPKEESRNEAVIGSGVTDPLAPPYHYVPQ